MSWALTIILSSKSQHTVLSSLFAVLFPLFFAFAFFYIRVPCLHLLENVVLPDMIRKDTSLPVLRTLCLHEHKISRLEFTDNVLWCKSPGSHTQVWCEGKWDNPVLEPSCLDLFQFESMQFFVIFASKVKLCRHELICVLRVHLTSVNSNDWFPNVQRLAG